MTKPRVKEILGIPLADQKQLRHFALVMALAFGLLSLLFWFIEHISISVYVIALALGWVLFGIITPKYLQPFYIIWMLLARVLAFINTHLLLAFIFYTLFTVTGLLMKLFKRDPLNRGLDKDAKSYWHRPEKTLLSDDHYKRQF